MRGIRVDREKFWNLYRVYKLGTVVNNKVVITKGTVDSLNYILDRFETEARLDNIPQFSYVLATMYHEAGRIVQLPNKTRVWERFKPIIELKGSPSSNVWKKYQYKYWNTGYYGRGLVQVTWEENYRKVGNLIGVGELFVKNPDKLLEIRYSYEVAIEGMVHGIFRKDRYGNRHTLDRYLPNNVSNSKEYTAAREIINGDRATKGLEIANIAVAFETIITSSKIDSIEVPSLNVEWDVENVSVEALPENVNDYVVPIHEPNAPVEEIPEAPITVSEDVYAGNESFGMPLSTPLTEIEVEKTESTNIGKKTVGVLTGIFTGSYIVPGFIQNFFNDNFSETYASLIINLLPVLIISALIFLLVYYVVKKINRYKLTELYIKTNTNPDIHNVKFVENSKQASETSFFRRR